MKRPKKRLVDEDIEVGYGVNILQDAGFLGVGERGQLVVTADSPLGHLLQKTLAEKLRTTHKTKPTVKK